MELENATRDGIGGEFYRILPIFFWWFAGNSKLTLFQRRYSSSVETCQPDAVDLTKPVGVKTQPGDEAG